MVASAERLPLRTLTTADGLSNNVINAIVGDSRGFVWFCTREGLAQFDGHGFTTFGLADGLPSAVVHALVETKAGEYWIGTGDGLVRFDPYGGQSGGGGQGAQPTFVRHAPGTDHRARRVASLLERREGGLWVGTGLGLFRLEAAGRSWRFEAEPLLGRTPEIGALAEDAAGALWIGTSEGLYRWRPGEPPVQWTERDADRPDVVLTDLGLPGMSGVEGIRQIKQRHVDLPIHALTVFDTDDKVFEAICAGASGYVLKNTRPAKLLEAIEEVADGGAPMSPEVARRVVRLFRTFQPPPGASCRLTPQEHALLELLADGHHRKTAAHELGISINTVSFHLKHLYQKLQVHSKTEAVAKALRERLV